MRETKGNGIKIAGITASAFLEQFFTGIVRPPNGNSRPSYADASKLSRDSSNKSRDREKSSVSESGEGIGKIPIQGREGEREREGKTTTNSRYSNNSAGPSGAADSGRHHQGVASESTDNKRTTNKNDRGESVGLSLSGRDPRNPSPSLW